MDPGMLCDFSIGFLHGSKSLFSWFYKSFNCSKSLKNQMTDAPSEIAQRVSHIFLLCAGVVLGIARLGETTP